MIATKQNIFDQFVQSWQDFENNVSKIVGKNPIFTDCFWEGKFVIWSQEKRNKFIVLIRNPKTIIQQLV